jgi:hypothetical protein
MRLVEQVSRGVRRTHKSCRPVLSYWFGTRTLDEPTLHCGTVIANPIIPRQRERVELANEIDIISLADTIHRAPRGEFKRVVEPVMLRSCKHRVPPLEPEQ